MNAAFDRQNRTFLSCVKCLCSIIQQTVEGPVSDEQNRSFTCHESRVLHQIVQFQSTFCFQRKFLFQSDLYQSTGSRERTNESESPAARLS